MDAPMTVIVLQFTQQLYSLSSVNALNVLFKLKNYTTQILTKSGTGRALRIVCKGESSQTLTNIKHIKKNVNHINAADNSNTLKLFVTNSGGFKGGRAVGAAAPLL